MQKDRGWKAGSKTGMLRGLNTKNRADLELFLNWLGLRIDFKETQGLFGKTAGRSGIYVYGPSDQDPVDQIEPVRRSNLVRPLQIGRPTGFADAGGGGARRESVSRGGAAPKPTGVRSCGCSRA